MNHLQTFAQARKGRPSHNRGKTFPIEVLTGEEVKALLKSCNPKCPTGSRNRALLGLLYRGMLRVSEALSLYPRDVDLQSGMVNVRRGKGSKQRIVGLDPGACQLFGNWLAKRQALGFGPQTPIFVTLKGRQLQSTNVRNLLSRLREKCGILKRIHPHGLRHTGAVELVTEGHDLVTIAGQLGHSNCATTDRYIRHLCPQKLVSAMNARSWEL